MRDKNRIDAAINEIEKIWINYPDLRLGQLLLNAVKEVPLYYMEDELLISQLKEYYK